MKFAFPFAAAVRSAAGLFLSATASQAALSYATNFDDLSPRRAISQQFAWQTDDTYDPASQSGQSDAPRIINGYSQTSSDNWGILGGLTGFAPGRLTISLWKPIDTAGILAQTTAAYDLEFSVDASITSSQIPRPNHDSFGWSFRNSSGVALFQLSLDYNAVNDSMKLSFIDGNGTATATTNGIQFDAAYTYIFDANLADVTSDTISLKIRDSFGTTSTIFANKPLPEANGEPDRGNRRGLEDQECGGRCEWTSHPVWHELNHLSEPRRSR